MKAKTKEVPAPVSQEHGGYDLLSVCVFVIAACLVAAAVVIYATTYQHGFSVLDDDDYVVRNLIVQAGLTAKGFAWAMTTGAVANWHPLTWLSHMADCQAFGLSAGASHVVSMLFHAANGVLLFLVLRAMTGALWRSAFVAMLFIAHPLHVESVAWVAERKDVLSTFFWLLAMGAYLRYVRRPGVLAYLPVAVAFALGLMAKPMVVTLPCVLLLLDYWPLNRFTPISDGKGKAPRRSWRPVVEKIPLFALSAASSIITVVVQQRGGAMRSLEASSLGLRVENAVVAYARYLIKAVWPLDLSVYYPLATTGLPWWQVAGALLLLAAVTAGVVYAARRSPYLAVGWFWYLGALVPVIGLVQVGSQAMADRYMYVPLIGLAIMLAWGAHDCGLRIAEFATRRGGEGARPRALRRVTTALAAAGALIVLACGVLAARQVGYWSDNVLLFEHALAVTDDNDFTQYNLGIALKRAGQRDEAYGHFERAVELRPNYVSAIIYLGLIKYEQRDYDAAIRLYEHALEYAAGHPNQADAENDLGAALCAQGKMEEAARHYQKAIQIDPNNPDTHFNLASTLRTLGKNQEAMAHVKEALQLNPNFTAAQSLRDQLASDTTAQQPAAPLPKLESPEKYYARGNELADQKRYADAAAHYEEAIRLRPDYVDARVNLGNALAVQGRLREAVTQYQEVLRRKPNNPDAELNLGNALSELGQLDDAIAAFTRALQLRPNHVDTCCALGYTLAKRGKLDESEKQYTKALALNPSCEQAKEALKNIAKFRQQK